MAHERPPSMPWSGKSWGSISELGGSPCAAVASFFLFSIGAVIPIIPSFITSGTAALVAAICSAALGLFLMGTLVTL